MYIYPDNLKAQSMLFCWSWKSVVILIPCVILSVFIMAHGGSSLFLILCGVGALLTIQFEDITLLRYMRISVRFLITRQQCFYWRCGS